SDPPPLVSIVNITKVAYPLSLPADGGVITFTYKVNNPGAVPLSDVTVDDDKCSAMSGRLGDTNGNNLLDVNEVWIYTCAAVIKQTTTNTANVVAFANGLRAVGSATITVRVDSPVPGLPNQPVPNLPNTGGGRPSLKIIVWTILEGILAALIIIFFLIRKNKTGKT
ncbi:MAG: hypothetical protein Q8P49_04615, partial [Candidatus Liptonbacteria bacterium]|nr:hypothetical protein [Candidatus Liptonbacteria bacterium]